MPSPASDRPSFTDEEALAFHAGDKPGKLEIRATKPMATQRDLSLAYSPGVAVPGRAVAQKSHPPYDYTTPRQPGCVLLECTPDLSLREFGAPWVQPVVGSETGLLKS